jgi:hypothetical protein
MTSVTHHPRSERPLGARTTIGKRSLAHALVALTAAAGAAALGLAAAAGAQADSCSVCTPPDQPLIGIVNGSGQAAVKEGMSSSWDDEYNGAKQVAVATDPKNGPLIAVLTDSGEVLVKEGSLTATWTTETITTTTTSGGTTTTTTGPITGALQVAVASDASNGPLIAVLTGSGQLLVKEGSVTAPWHAEYTGVLNLYGGFAVASDPSNGPLIGLITDSGQALVKEGSLSALWTTEETGGAQGIAVASDPSNGPLIGLITSEQALVKEGSLTAPWTTEYNGSDAGEIAVASDPSNGPLIGVKTLIAGPWGEVLVKEGSLTAPWNQEYGGTSTNFLANQLALASYPTNGPLIAVAYSVLDSSPPESNGVVAKQGSLTATWSNEYNDANGVVLYVAVAG